MKHPTGMKESNKTTYTQFKNYILTNRRPQHFFLKYQSYGISKIELNTFPKNITHVLIFFHPGKGKPTQYYLSRIEQWKNGLTWNNILKNNVPDPQLHVKLNEMVVYHNIEDVPEPKEVRE